MAGKFITFEGIEGSGKTTQINLLKDYLISKKYDVFLTREPGGTKISDEIRKILLSTENKGMFPIAELLLYCAARNQHIEEKIRPALTQNKIVICDRFSDATTAYQGAARKIDKKVLMQLDQIATNGLKPDLTLIFDLPSEEGVARARKRNDIENLSGKEDRFELEKIEFHKNVRNGYLAIAKSEPDRVKIINASRSVEEVQMLIKIEIDKFLCGHK